MCTLNSERGNVTRELSSGHIGSGKQMPELDKKGFRNCRLGNNFSALS